MTLLALIIQKGEKVLLLEALTSVMPYSNYDANGNGL